MVPRPRALVERPRPLACWFNRYQHTASVRRGPPFPGFVRSPGFMDVASETYTTKGLISKNKFGGLSTASPATEGPAGGPRRLRQGRPIPADSSRPARALRSGECPPTPNPGLVQGLDVYERGRDTAFFLGVWCGLVGGGDGRQGEYRWCGCGFVGGGLAILTYFFCGFFERFLLCECGGGAVVVCTILCLCHFRERGLLWCECVCAVGWLPHTPPPAVLGADGERLLGDHLHRLEPGRHVPLPRCVLRAHVYHGGGRVPRRPCMSVSSMPR